MDERKALLSAIWAEPAEDTPRLVFADWLDEHGEPERAEFIRLQVKVARMTFRDRGLGLLRNREWELLHAHKSEWLGARLEAAPAVCWGFKRGFPDTLHMAELDLGDAGLAALLRSPRLRNLSILELGFNIIGAAGARTITNCDSLSSLATLNLSSNELGDRGVVTLAASRNLANLTSLDLWGNRIGDEGAFALAESRSLQKLAHLGIGNNRMGTRALNALRSRFGDGVRAD